MKILITKAIEILDLNLKESRGMPSDVKLALNLALENLVGLRTERSIHGFTRIGQLPSEDVGQLSPSKN